MDIEEALETNGQLTNPDGFWFCIFDMLRSKVRCCGAGNDRDAAACAQAY